MRIRSYTPSNPRGFSTGDFVKQLALVRDVHTDVEESCPIEAFPLEGEVESARDAKRHRSGQAETTIQTVAHIDVLRCHVDARDATLVSRRKPTCCSADAAAGIQHSQARSQLELTGEFVRGLTSADVKLVDSGETLEGARVVWRRRAD